MSNIDEMAQILADYLSDYSESITVGVKKAVDTVAKEVNVEIKKHITFNEHTGEYVKAFRIKGVFDGKYNKGKVWHVSGEQYRLTHLLENGHALNQGGRSRAYPHIKYGEELAQRRMEELAREAIENAGD
jgi:hypothetical protein